ncbi:MAG TPA: apolipoprotein N-acyltransferase [Nitrospiria bacterium]|nr:apolipoprotein N-acyltransferase [Nitrospiria bacterium]
MLWRLVRLLVLPVASGMLLALSFPRYDFESLAWIALVPLLLAIRGASWKAAFSQGWLTGLVFFAWTLSWVINAMHEYGRVPLIISFFVMLLLAGYCALFVGLFTTILSRIKDWRGLTPVWTAPLLWVVLELARAHLFSGFPWALLGYSQFHNLSLIQIADVTGVYGVSYLLVLVNALVARIAEAIIARTTAHDPDYPISLPWISAPLAAAVIALVVAYGHWRLSPQTDMGMEHTVRIGLVQPNINEARKWDVLYRRETMDRHERLTAQVVQGADLVIWPEASTPFLFDVETAYRDEVLTFVRDHGVPLLFGSPALANRTDDQPRLTNSAYLVSGDGTVLDRYDKVHLVPFGEYVPLKTVLFFLDKLVVGIGDFVPGPGPHVMSGPGGQFGIVICFEVIFPDLVRQFVDQGADYMVTITNDAWFGDSGAPYQHFAMVVFRAIENRIPFARAANTGISGFIDAEGHILRTTEIFVEGALSGEIRTGNPRTFYTANGDLFAYGCGILTLLITPVAWRRARRASRRPRARRREEPSDFSCDPF